MTDLYARINRLVNAAGTAPTKPARDNTIILKSMPEAVEDVQYTHERIREQIQEQRLNAKG
jgi:hypothetical protein